MLRDVKITVIGESDSGNPFEAPDRTVTNAVGSLEDSGEHILVSFEENDEESGQVLKTTLRFNGDMLEVTRRGLLESVLTFKRDERWESAYETPYGSFLMATRTGHFEKVENEDKINLHVGYDMEINNDFVSKNKTFIEIEFI
ncbi:MAG: DUF1934 domain-containing protein [Lachnospiraceae bacterium]|nr:DUF1934 domain-containing protein [Lachnospiraceae bacterium]